MKRALLLLFVGPAMLLCGATAADHAGKGYLKVNATPDKAGVFVDGEYFGPAARFASTRKYLITPGKHEIRLADPRCEDATATVQIEAGKTVTITETLKPKEPPKPPYGTLRVICSYNLAAVMLNNEYVGHVDEFNSSAQGLQVAPGSYDVRIDVNGQESVVWQRVAVEAGKTTIVRWDY